MIYLNASVHCLFCHPHSDGTLNNGNVGINKTPYTEVTKTRRDELKTTKGEQQFTHHEEYYSSMWLWPPPCWQSCFFGLPG